MRNKGALLLPLLLFAVVACEGDERKQAFAAYERKVDPILEKEARLRSRFEDQVKDAVTYAGGGAELEKLIEDRLAPFYDEMEKEVAAIEPEGPDLARIHSLLARYVDLRRRIFDGYFQMNRQADTTAKALKPYILEVDAARSGAENTGTKLQNLAESAPQEVQQKFAILFQQESRYQQAFWGQEKAVETGSLSGKEFRQSVESQIRPRYERLAKALEAMPAEGDEADLVEAARNYVSAMLKTIDAGLKLADAAPTSGVTGKQLEALQQEASETLTTYKEEAKKYRDGLN